MATAARRDYYEVLGVPHGADPKQIKDAFRELALKYHPDRNKAPDAEARFKEIAEAYAVLSDPEKRAAYDARGFAGVAGFTAEDLFGGIDFGDIFGDLGFGLDLGWGEGGLFERLFGWRRPGPSRGQDLKITLAVPLDTIGRGGKETVRYTRPVTCPRCHGTGAEPGTAPRTCHTCNGSGRKVITRDERQGEAGIRFQQVTVCPDCGGRGTVIDTPCRECHGSGRVERDERLEVRIPPGAEEGMALRIPAHGLPSPDAKGPAGDLYVIVTSLPDTRFVRNGPDLWRSEALDVTDGVLGTTLKVPTLDGTVDVTVPPGTQAGEVLRLRGKGLPRFGGQGRGDLYLRIEVKIPEHLTAEEQALYEKLRVLSQNRPRPPT